jgi:hypothetical protein
MLKGQLFYRTQCLKTTWRLRLGVIGASVLSVWLTRGIWIPGIGRSLVCREHVADRVDAILVDNLDQNYLLFERAAELQKAGTVSQVYVPTESSDADEPSVVTDGIVTLMARVAWLRQWKTIPVQHIEPISLNAAYRMRDVLKKERVRSLVVVTPGFRSRRASLVYQRVFGEAGISVSCLPVFGQQTPETWARTWHGIEQVGEQFLKLQYYRFYVLPMETWESARGGVRASNEQIE